MQLRQSKGCQPVRMRIESGFCTAHAQLQFFTAWHLLDLHFAPQRSRFVDAYLSIQQLHRSASPRVLGSLACIMGGESLVEVVGDAAVEGVVGALEEGADPTHR